MLANSVDKQTENLNTDLLSVAIKSFRGEIFGAISSVAYDESDPEKGYIGGGERWSALQRNTKKFNILEADKRSLSDNAEAIADTVHKHRDNQRQVHFYDVAPGDQAAEKTRPVIRAFNNEAKGRRVAYYTALEGNPDFGSNAALCIGREIPRIFTNFSFHDIFTSPVTEAIDGHQLAQIPNRKSIVFYAGSTVGNISTTEKTERFPIDDFTKHMEMLADYSAEETYLVVSHDTRKTAEVLEDYSEPENEAFALNPLHQIKFRLPTRRFNPDAFSYDRKYYDTIGLVGHHWVSKCKQTFYIGDEKISLEKGDIAARPFNSFKIDDTDFREMSVTTGYTPLGSFFDPDEIICTQVLKGHPNLLTKLRQRHGFTM